MFKYMLCVIIRDDDWGVNPEVSIMLIAVLIHYCEVEDFNLLKTSPYRQYRVNVFHEF